jgi:V/A-type H+-transporting ATPase subunit E
MDAIDKMIAELDQESQAKRQKIEAERSAQIETDFAIAWSQKEAELKKHAVQAAKQAEKNTQQEINRRQKNAQQEQVRQGHQQVENLFEKAYQKLVTLAPAQVRQLAEAALHQLPLTGEVIFRCGTQEATSLNPEWLAVVNQQLSYKLVFGHPLEQAGFVVEDNGVNYNFTYRALLEEYKNDTIEYWFKKIQRGG